MINNIINFIIEYWKLFPTLILFIISYIILVTKNKKSIKVIIFLSSIVIDWSMFLQFYIVAIPFGILIHSIIIYKMYIDNKFLKYYTYLVISDLLIIYNIITNQKLNIGFIWILYLMWLIMFFNDKEIDNW